MYWKTRADDLIVKAIVGLLERNPNVPPERIDDVAIAATTQTGDQGLTLGRTAAILAGLPKSVPGYAIDRMCAGAMTAVTTIGRGDRLRGVRPRASPEASSTWATTRWASAPTRTRVSSPRSWSARGAQHGSRPRRSTTGSRT